MNLEIKKIIALILFVLPCLCMAGCSNNDDEDFETEDNTGKGHVKITSLEAVRKTSTGLQINVKIQATGVTDSEVKMLGVVGGATSDADGNLWASVGAGKTSGSTKIVAGLKSKTTYYVKAFLQTKEGTVYSSIRSVKTP